MQANEARLHDLLADRATGDLGGEDRLELQGLLATQSGLDDDSFDLAAATIELVFLETAEPLPRSVRERVLSQASEVDKKSLPSASASVTPFPNRPSSSDPMRWMGWWAAAAALILAAAGWWSGADTAIEDPPVMLPTQAELRASLKAEPGVVEKEWTATEDPDAAGAGGDVLWNTAQQRGYMRFAGLPINDPSAAQYQLWIFDAEQDERYPIDGGVFNIDSAEEVLVPIDPKIQVRQPTLFAITIEKPGGVVVSSRERIVLVAAVS